MPTLKIFRIMGQWIFSRLMRSFTYVINCVNQVYAGALRGAGNSRASMVAMLSSFVVFRQIYLYVIGDGEGQVQRPADAALGALHVAHAKILPYVMAHFISNEIVPIAMGYPAGWLVCSVIMVIYFRKVKLTRTRARAPL